MKRDSGFENLSGQMTSAEIGLGWLDGLTLRTAAKAVSVRPHQHQHMEVILCLRGELSYEIDGHPPVTLGADMGIVISAHTRHALTHDSESPGERIGLHLLGNMSARRDYAVFSPSDYAGFRRVISESAARPFRLSPSIKANARELANFLKRPSKDISSSERGHIRIICCSILYDLVQTLSRPQTANSPQLMDEAVRYIESHFAEPLLADDLVRHMGYSRASLYMQFKRHTGLTPNEFLTRLRIEKAQELLKSTDRTVVKIASASGFSSPEYFSAVFRRYVGQTPTDYRIRHAAPKCLLQRCFSQNVQSAQDVIAHFCNSTLTNRLSASSPT